MLSVQLSGLSNLVESLHICAFIGTRVFPDDRVQARGRLGEIVAPVGSRVALRDPEGDKNFALDFL